MEEVIARLDAWMKENHPGYEEWEPGASGDEIAELEKALATTLPAGLRLLLEWRSTVPLIFNQETMDCSTIAAHFEDMGAMADVDEWDDPNHWHKGWFAFSTDGGDCLVIDPLGSFGGSPGQVLDFDHEGGDEKTIVAPDFDSWLTAFVHALDAGVFVYNEEDEDVSEADGRSFDAVIAQRCPGYPKTVSP